ncbi:RIP metalloprotease RseP [Loktanella sp. S4079]|uniref:RIP metalloprotease RseP n=1 Tax=Loktanella sp. S4079 TaxID=579483 RepID=UPI0005FA5A4D|nr:RIP metalloprotease RseP [Loktanella sp. S4079]KJZ20106.1 zinc metalloprotease [Loktanella sp. S4079]
MNQIVPLFGNVAFAIAAFVVALSIIVTVHEYGHYIVGRWSGIHADVFSVGFGPVLISRVDKRATRWQIAALPLGGYVKFLGDANAASVGSEDVAPDIDPRKTMEGAPLWARAATVLAGPVFNFVLAILVFAGSAMVQGQSVDPLTFDHAKPLPDSYQNDLLPGDVMLAVDGHQFDDATRTERLIDLLPVEQSLEYTVLRDGVEMTVMGPYLMPSLIGQVIPRSAADESGVLSGDVVQSVDDTPIFSFMQLQDVVTQAAGEPVTLSLWNEGETREVTLAARVTDQPLPEGGFETKYMIGVTSSFFFEPLTERVSPISALGFGVQSVWRSVTTTLSGMKHMVLGNISTCSLSGPVGIAETSASMARKGVHSFVWLIGALSAAVGLVNLLPIPVLDGGHLVLYAYEGVARRKPSERAIQVFMFIGLAIILTAIPFTILNDTVLCP